MKSGKAIGIGVLSVLVAVMLAGCKGNDWDENAEAPRGEITPVSREEGSGTRGAFTELVGLEEDIDGETFDMTTARSEVTNSTAVTINSVSGNKSAIGYISLGSMNDMIKPLAIDGVMPSIETVKDGSYKIARPFNIVYRDDLSEIGQDFVQYIMSDQGQSIIEEAGYVSQGSEGKYSPSLDGGGSLSVSGSSSVEPVMEKLAEEYEVLNPDVNIEVQVSDSTTGVSTVLEGVTDIGMASRNLNDSEVQAGAIPKVIAMDGIVVIVNKQNPLDELTTDQLRAIYSGEAKNWEDIL